MKVPDVKHGAADNRLASRPKDPAGSSDGEREGAQQALCELGVARHLDTLG